MSAICPPTLADEDLARDNITVEELDGLHEAQEKVSAYLVASLGMNG